MLDEVRSATGALLWQAVRDVVLWATTPEDARSRLFGEDAYDHRVTAIRAREMEDDVRKWLILLAGVVSGREQPGREEISRTCRRISRWADETQLPRTAIWYAQAASLCFPEGAEHAYNVGWLLRRSQEYPRAEAWYRRAIGLARRRRDAHTYARAYMGLGNLYIQRDEYERARLAFERALQTARRAGLRKLRAEAFHDLFSVAAETKQVVDAEIYARKAFHAYPSGHPRLPQLAHDVAVFWMLQGFYNRALPVFESVARVLTRPADRLLILSNLARAAGGAGRIDVFTSAWADTWQIVDDKPHLECVTSSLLRLAYGSALLRDWERVDLAARFALELATRRGQQAVRREAEEVLSAAEQQRFTETVLPAPAEVAVTDAADALAGHLVRRLAACAGGEDRPRMDC
ncbi:MAG TPA: tetratricopeptide repeat protein [Longimicrobiaceae bacterium]|nr:tetratricopeptide repeat protein [Longimicrobiaceae bacterium]